MELEIIVEQFQKKDAIAFQKLYNMYSENICGVINTIVKNTEVAEEICQDVFMKAWNNAESYNASKGRFFTWILNIARNAAIDEIRSKSYKNNKKNLSADYFVGILESVTDNEDGKEDIIGLKKLLVDLKEKCIKIIELLYFKGLTQKEVSEELDIPLGTVKTRNRSCISQIRTNITL
ncbi:MULTISPECIES: RNA polymerase sigma factor [unclassified Arenibacter]|uniref:RNA polymerase sigma factor n=1 Tax=unclassified Arenibacter TaxID=2615047 RepID=UPI000E34C519|nr:MULTISPECIES: sigma-70 family RNA polymerase sigma factor [unclassified Arenibacter]MCM4163076.1 RNA polymerase subunit sigma-70 [Arenibacter sp. A80]RFT57110.1 sigma-70 family RNA polymerase sigma factor [Arenibacter sp. P308M17]